MNIKKLSLLLLSITLLNTVYCSESDDELDLLAELASIVDTASRDEDLLRAVSRGLSSIALSDGEKTPFEIAAEKQSGRISGGTKFIEKIEKRKDIQARSAEIHKARQVAKRQEGWKPASSPIQKKRSSSTSLDPESKKPAPASFVTSPRFTPALKTYEEEEREDI